MWMNSSGKVIQQGRYNDYSNCYKSRMEEVISRYTSIVFEIKYFNMNRPLLAVYNLIHSIYPLLKTNRETDNTFVYLMMLN